MNKTILIIDDDVNICGPMAILLAERNFQVSTAKDGKEGLQKFRDNPPDLVITDIIMPRVEGLELIREMAKLKPKQKIIAMSGSRWSQLDYLSYAKAFGAIATLEKPFSKEALLDQVTAVLAEG